MDEIHNQINSVAGESLVNLIIWCIIPLAFVIEMILLSPNFMDMGTNDMGKSNIIENMSPSGNDSE